MRQVVGDADLLVELGLDVLDRDQLGLFRQSAEHLVEVALQRLGIDGANHADDQVGTGKKTLVQRLEIGGGDAGQRRFFALFAAGIGMVAVERLGPGRLGGGRGIVGVGIDAGDDLGANPVDRRLVEARFGQRQAQQLERLVLLIGEHAQRAVEGVAAGVEAHLGTGVVELLLERVAVEIADPRPSGRTSG